MRLGFVGDVWLRVDAMNRQQDSIEPSFDTFSAVKHLLVDHDLLMGNLECFFTTDLDNSHGRWKHRKALKSHPAYVQVLREAGFDVMNLANNHIMDGGAQGLQDTITALDQASLRWVGAGRDLEEAFAPTVVEREGRTIAFISAGDNSHDYASADGPGVAPMESFANLLRRTGELSREFDVVVVQLHCDLEFSKAPAPYRVKLCRSLIDQGATLVIQHHPHVVQGVERYKHGLIAYSLGNFVFRVHGNSYQSGYPDARNGWILSVDVDPHVGQVLDWHMEPVWISEEHLPVPASSDQYLAARNEFAERCALLESAQALRREWRRRCLQEARYHVQMTYYKARRGSPLRAGADLASVVLQPRNRYWLKGLALAGF